MLTYLAAGFAASLVLLLALAELHRHVSIPGVVRVDVAVQAFVHARSSAALTPIMRALTWVGSPMFVVPLCAVIASLLAWHGERREAALLLCSMLGATALVTALKLHFKRVRPDVPWSLVTEHTYSFPSGHSMMAVVLYGTLLYLFLRRLRGWSARGVVTLLAFLLAFGIGLSRIYLGAHFPSDVAAGYFCGSVWLLCLVAADLMVRREIPPLLPAR